MVGFEERKGDSGQFWGCPSRNAFWKTAESGRRPLDETPLPDRWWIRKIQRVKRKFRWLWGRLSVFPVGGPNRALLADLIKKYQFGSHGKTADENGSDQSRLLKCHVRREKGPHQIRIEKPDAWPSSMEVSLLPTKSLGQGRGNNFDSNMICLWFHFLRRQAI